MDLAVAMLDPEFREQVQDLEEAFKDPDTAIALQNLVTAFEIADDIEGAIDQAKRIVEQSATETDLNAMLDDAIKKARDSPNTPKPVDAAKMCKQPEASASAPEAKRGDERPAPNEKPLPKDAKPLPPAKAAKEAGHRKCTEPAVLEAAIAMAVKGPGAPLPKPAASAGEAVAKARLATAERL